MLLSVIHWQGEFPAVTVPYGSYTPPHRRGYFSTAQGLRFNHLFMLVELGVGLWANALVLIADAGHMFLDATALGLLGGPLTYPSAATTNNCLTATTAFRYWQPSSTTHAGDTDRLDYRGSDTALDQP